MTARKLLITAWALTIGMFLVTSEALAQPDCQWRERRPYGAYCPGPGWGSYGAKNPVQSIENVATLLRRYYENQDVAIGKIAERESYFAADIKDRNDNLIDRVIVDKRSGRIRSIY